MRFNTPSLVLAVSLILSATTTCHGQDVVSGTPVAPAEMLPSFPEPENHPRITITKASKPMVARSGQYADAALARRFLMPSYLLPSDTDPSKQGSQPHLERVDQKKSKTSQQHRKGQKQQQQQQQQQRRSSLTKRMRPRRLAGERRDDEDGLLDNLVGGSDPSATPIY
ncbi:hypothetical protein BGZ65_007174, partial [Modicella reniformis]